MMECKQIGKGVWIDLTILQIDDLSWTNKIILAEIIYLELDKEYGVQIQNLYFEKKFGFNKANVSRSLTELSKKGYIEIDNTDTNRNYGRIIRVSFDYVPMKAIAKKKEIKQKISHYTKLIESAFSVLWSEHSEYRKQYGNIKHGRRGDTEKIYSKIVDNVKNEFFDEAKEEDMYKIFNAINEFVKKYKNGIQTKYLINILDGDTIIDEIKKGDIGND